MSNCSWYCICILFQLYFEYSYFKAMTIIAKLSFWIMKPKKRLIITGLVAVSQKKIQPFEESILDALDQFKMGGYVKKLQTSITQESLSSNKNDVVEFLYNQIAHT